MHDGVGRVLPSPYPQDTLWDTLPCTPLGNLTPKDTLPPPFGIPYLT